MLNHSVLPLIKISPHAKFGPLFVTCNTNEDGECKADQKHYEDQDKMPFRKTVEPHWR